MSTVYKYVNLCDYTKQVNISMFTCVDTLSRYVRYEYVNLSDHTKQINMSMITCEITLSR